MLSRRDLVAKLAAGTAAVWAGSVARRSMASTHRAINTASSFAHGEGAHASPPSSTAAAAEGLDQPASAPVTSSAPAPWELLHPLRAGAEVGHGWRVAELRGVEDGSCVLTLANRRGRAQRIHLCANAGRPQGLVYTARVDLVVMNGGQGDLPTEEGLAQAVAAVAHVLAVNESQRQPARVVAALEPHAARLQRYAAAASLR